jgi:hypothetical protein
MAAQGRDRYFALSYYFAKVASWPDSDARLQFPTARRAFDSYDDLETIIERIRVPALPKDYEPFGIRTHTEFFTPVFTGEWHDHYWKKTDFTGFLWHDREFFIAQTSRDVFKAFVRNVREKTGEAMFLQHLEVPLAKLSDKVSHARTITLEQNFDSGLPGQIRRLRATGRDVEESEEVKHYKAGGGVGTGLEFDYPYRDWPDIGLAVSSDGSIRLLSHIGSAGDPNVPMELAIVTHCFTRLVEPIYSVKSPKRGKKRDRPGPVEGQKSLDEYLES